MTKSTESPLPAAAAPLSPAENAHPIHAKARMLQEDGNLREPTDEEHRLILTAMSNGGGTTWVADEFGGKGINDTDQQPRPRGGMSVEELMAADHRRHTGSVVAGGSATLTELIRTNGISPNAPPRQWVESAKRPLRIPGQALPDF